MTFPPGAGRPDGARRAQPVVRSPSSCGRRRLLGLQPSSGPGRALDSHRTRSLTGTRSERNTVLSLPSERGGIGSSGLCGELRVARTDALSRLDCSRRELVPFRSATAVPRTGQRGASHGPQASRASPPPDGRRGSPRRSQARGPACEADPRSPSSGLAGAACRRAPQSARDVSGRAACSSFRVSTGGPRIADGLQEALLWLNSASRVGRRQVCDDAALRCGAVAMGESVLPHDHRLWSWAGG